MAAKSAPDISPAKGPTPTRELVDAHLQRVLGETLDDFVKARRTACPRVSWQVITREIWANTGRSVSTTTLWNWYPEHAPDKANAR